MLLYKHKLSLASVFLFTLIFLSFLSFGTIGILWIRSEYIQFKRISTTYESEYINSQKAILKGEVERVIDFINYMRTQTEKRLRQNVKDRTHEAYHIAMNIYEQNKASFNKSVIEKMIKDALRPIRFNNARGYYFAADLNGIEQLFADKPELEGQNLIEMRDTKGKYVIKDMIALIKEKGEGFYSYTWTKPNVKGRNFPKIAFD
jgi:signal transduction histidine kinase